MTDYIKTLPADYIYNLSEFTGDYSDAESNYKAIFHVSLRTMNDVSEWINTFSRQTQTNWNVRDTHKELQILQRKDFVCHMKDYHHRPKTNAKSSHRYKHCDCPAKITFKIKQVNRNSCQRYHWVRDGMPTTVFIDYNQNHAILNAEALSFRKIDPIIRDVFDSYFDQGMSPTAAADFHIHQLHFNPETEDDPIPCTDASRNPSRSTVAYFYRLWRQTNLGDRHGDGICSQESKFSSSELFNISATQAVDPPVDESHLPQKRNREDVVQSVLSRWKDLSAHIESALCKHINRCDERNLVRHDEI